MVTTCTNKYRNGVSSINCRKRSGPRPSKVKSELYAELDTIGILQIVNNLLTRFHSKYIWKQNKKRPKRRAFIKGWLRTESNRRHKDFQSFALPTELLSQIFYFRKNKMAVPTGIEPAISCVTGRHVNRYTTGPVKLLYKEVTHTGFEPVLPP